MAEYLRLKDDTSEGSSRHSWGADALASVSCNIPVDERGLKLDAGKCIYIIYSLKLH